MEPLPPPPTLPPAPRSCGICTDSAHPDDLVKPCRQCSTDYCRDCLVEMFNGAANDSTRMPPRCCTFLQIHTSFLSDEDAIRYRKRFEEWVTVNKVYCPSPTCSTFIPEGLLPNRLVSLSNSRRSIEHFLCPACHIGVCVKCKQVEHGTTPCDTSVSDHEMAMLEQFRYKRCPLCKHAVKKMFGCSHMQCVCGAHWCYYCQKSIHECDGSCPDREDSENEEGEDDDDDGDESVPSLLTTMVNLDGGGARRWADSDYDFGEEPEEVSHIQIWSCRHSFRSYKAAD
ncbi:hypothetical protein BAUCODRAFT_60950, partial [Baudoinia panamericana UAMH 10762]